MAEKFEIVDQNLPFFAYGLFKSDELAYHRIEKHVLNISSATVRGTLFEKDGMVLLKKKSRYDISGELLRFKEGEWKEAYNTINEFEPFYYKWDRILIDGQKCYCLLYNNDLKGTREREGNNLKNSSVEMDNSYWSSKEDPLFLQCMEFLYHESFGKGFFSHNREEEYADDFYYKNIVLGNEEKILRDMFRLQMWYVLLYSVLNRYSNFKFGVQDINKDEAVGEAKEKKGKKGKKGTNIPSIHDDCFAELYSYQYTNQLDLKAKGRSVRSNDGQYNATMDGSEKGFSNYFRIVRNNAVHRGKAMFKDIDNLEFAFLDLYYILFNVFKANGVPYPKEMVEKVKSVYNQ